MKTASTTIEAVLGRYYDARVFIHRHRMWIPSSCIDYFIIGTVRNPYVREISRYIWSKTHPYENPDTFGEYGSLPFSEYLQKLNYNHSLCGAFKYKIMRGTTISPAKNPRIDAIIHQENLHNDMLKLPFIRYTDIKDDVLVPTLNRTPDARFESCQYTYRDANLLYEKFEDDFVRFEYSRKPIKELCTQML